MSFTFRKFTNVNMRNGHHGHYVNNSVSGWDDPVISFRSDEPEIKGWLRRTFKHKASRKGKSKVYRQTFIAGIRAGKEGK